MIKNFRISFGHFCDDLSSNLKKNMKVVHTCLIHCIFDLMLLKPSIPADGVSCLFAIQMMMYDYKIYSTFGSLILIFFSTLLLVTINR